MTFGATLRDLRRASGLTQEELATRARLSTKAISALERGVNRAPRKETLQLLMKALRLSTRDRAALESLARLSRRDVMLDVPSADTPRRPSVASLGATLAPLPAPPWLRTPHSSAGIASRRLVGRIAELAAIDRHLSREAPPVLLIRGEPGIGKTRLLREASERALEQGYAVIDGGCHRRSGQEPYAPLPSTLNRYLTTLPSSQVRTALVGCDWLSRLLPELAQEGILVPPADLPAEQERRLMFRAVARFLANVAGPTGTLLVLDDLQWASADSLDLLASLARPPTPGRLRIAAACRNSDFPWQARLWETLADLEREGFLETIDLAPLARGEAQRLLADLVQGPLEPLYAQSIVQRTGGVPFFLVSCAQLMSQARTTGLGGAGIPWTVAQSVRQRVAVLPGDGRRVLGAAAVIGRRVALPLLAALGQRLNQTLQDVRETIDAACLDHLLVEDGPESVLFAHDLIREALESDLGPGIRAALHCWVAEELEQAPGESALEVLAYHYSMGGEREKAADYLERSGARALAMRAYAEAARTFGELAAQLEALGRQREAALARERQGVAFTTAAQYDEALAVLESAAAFYEAHRFEHAHHDVDNLVQVLAEIGEAHAQRATSDEGIARLEASLRTFGDHDPSPCSMAALYLALAWLVNTTGRFSDALALAEQAARLATAAGDAVTLVKANLRRGHLLLMLQRMDEGISLFRQALLVLEESQDYRSLRFALNNLGWIHEARGDFETDRQYTERALQAAIRLDDPSLVAFMWSNNGSPAFNLGDWKRARQDFERGIALMRPLQPSWASAWPPLLLGQLCMAEGQQEEGRRLLDEAIVYATRNTDLQALRWAHGTLAERELLQGKSNLAIERLEVLLDRPGEQVIDVTNLLPLLAWAYVDSGIEHRASVTVEEAIRRAESGGLLPALAHARRSRGLLWWKRGDWDRARDDLGVALALARRMHYPYDAAKTLYRLGQVEASAGRVFQARRRLTAARHILLNLGERVYHDCVVEMLGRLDGAEPTRIALRSE
jgi:tetratricopeptide (TPR) repeat protein/transcriptional regulator with XRE-family HTH domain